MFQAARGAAPALVFLDELDALVGSRGIGSGSGGGGGLLATLLVEMDGVQAADGVLVVGATNRPGALDPALLRPGRLDVQVEVPLPDAAGRAEVLAVHTRGVPLGRARRHLGDAQRQRALPRRIPPRARGGDAYA